MEGMKLKGLPITSLVADHLMVSGDPMLDTHLKSWQEIVKICRIGDASKLLRCCVCDMDFEQNMQQYYILIVYWNPTIETREQRIHKEEEGDRGKCARFC